MGLELRQGLATPDFKIPFEVAEDLVERHAFLAGPLESAEPRFVDGDLTQARLQEFSCLLFRVAPDLTNFAAPVRAGAVVGDVPPFPAALAHPPVAPHGRGPLGAYTPIVGIY